MYAMRQQQEHDLIERIAGGDTEAFAVLVDRYAHTVHALVARIVVTAEDAEEVTQDVFLKVFDHLPRFDGRSSLATWIYRIAFNTRPRDAALLRRPLSCRVRRHNGTDGGQCKGAAAPHTQETICNDNLCNE